MTDNLDVTITVDEYENLLRVSEKYEALREELFDLRRDALMLQCYENAGVDNWDGREYAMELFRDLRGELDDDLE